MQKKPLVMIVGTSLLVLAFSAGFLINEAQADRQPLMRKALGQLKNARHTLKNAAHDKGGHRVKALEHVNKAIAQVKAGIRYDNRN